MQHISYKRHRFPPEVIEHAVWLYFRFALSFRDVEEMLAYRGIEVSYETIRCRCLKFAPQIARNLKKQRPSPEGEVSGSIETERPLSTKKRGPRRAGAIKPLTLAQQRERFSFAVAAVSGTSLCEVRSRPQSCADALKHTDPKGTRSTELYGRWVRLSV